MNESSSRTGLVPLIVLLFASAGCAPETGFVERAAAALEPSATPPGDASAADVTAPGEATLPDGFPAGFPMPEDLVINGARFTEGDATTQANFLVRGTSPATVNEVWGFFNGRLPEGGYEIERFRPLDAGANNAMVYFHDERFRDATVRLARSGDNTTVLINLPVRD